MNSHIKGILNRLLMVMALGSVLLPISAQVAASVIVDKAADEAIRASFKATRPDIVITNIEASGIPSLYVVTMDNGPTVYSSADGKYFIAGDMFEISAAGIESVAEKKLKPVRKELLTQVKREDMIIFSPEGESKGAIYVFTDVDCGYCRKLHQEVPQLNAMGIEVRYLGYPRAGLSGPTYDKMVSAWCADDPKLAMNALKEGGLVDPKTCTNPIAAEYQLGAQMGVTGTPAIVLEDGSMIPGYKTAVQLKAAVLN
ncbi:Thiol:disulfide interchange protein DsbC [Zhongshania aliphaticivorans]|uniref:Thiol:disulfide interchange protein n=1 Tax=Zhongshania aliphaticivorans TaxID=1470434 RepID=A0A5S9P2P0_9GAMM|nr:thioredoxin fold domain-containing protein [Zhongshania aliphaticivorans]CAA0097508.1 Thiol:disulfide interchange protein DsbC [Zhongshania aliphaticivorans]